LTLAPRRADTLAVAGVLFCLAAGLLTWAGTALMRAEPAPAAVPAPTTGGASSAGSVARSTSPPHPAQQSAQAANQQRAEARARARARTLNEKKSAEDRRQPARTGKAPGSTVQPVMQAPAPVATATDPERITIPSLGVDQGLVELAVNGDSLQVPEDFWDVGWWGGGPVPGENGAAVMVGHVDSFDGPAVFYGLSGMRRGDKVFVSRERGPRLVFAVRKKVLYDRDEFPSDRVYRSTGRPSLHLLTCGGSFDSEAELYSGNVVVYAELVATTKKSESGTKRHPHQTTRHREHHPDNVDGRQDQRAESQRRWGR
ncbi:MAG: class F sortase, partial [Nocardioidaceae bacterium]|nr:class F sortase [Nocardioidaceae bacterium]